MGELGAIMKRLRLARRNRRHRRVVDVAIDAGLKISEVDRIERGQPVPDDAVLIAWAWVAKVSPADALERAS